MLLSKGPGEAMDLFGQRPTYREYWNLDPNSTRAAENVAFQTPFLPPQNFNTILLGNQFFNGPNVSTALWNALPQKDRLGAWQNIIPAHEYMHLLNNTDDQGLLTQWTEKGAKIADADDPSVRLTLFIEQGCPH